MTLAVDSMSDGSRSRRPLSLASSSPKEIAYNLRYVVDSDGEAATSLATWDGEGATSFVGRSRAGSHSILPPVHTPWSFRAPCAAGVKKQPARRTASKQNTKTLSSQPANRKQPGPLNSGFSGASLAPPLSCGRANFPLLASCRGEDSEAILPA